MDQQTSLASNRICHSAIESTAKKGLQMKAPKIENIVTDEIREMTFVVMAHRTLTDGELYSAIRVEILKRKGVLTKGERLVITTDIS